MAIFFEINFEKIKDEIYKKNYIFFSLNKTFPNNCFYVRIRDKG